MKIPKRFPLILAFLTLAPSLAHADDQQLTVPLSLNNREGPQWVITVLQPTLGSRSEGPGALSYLVTSALEGAYQLQVDCDQDGSFGQDESFLIKPADTVCVWVKRRAGGQTMLLPYEIECRSGKDVPVFDWKPRYRFEGTLQFGTCQAKLVIFDTNGDGQLDRDDFRQATSVGIDQNGDGKFWGKEEWLRGEQIITFCGARFLIERVDPAGHSVTFLQSELPLLKLGSKVPAFELRTVDGSKLQLSQFPGRFVLLDFWASWCSPCVKQFPNIKALAQHFEDSLSVVSINVDRAERIETAKRIISDHQLGSWPQVVNGLGQQDPAWRIFGSDSRFVIPLYSLIDSEGTISYLGHSLDEVEAVLDARGARKSVH